MKKYLSGFVAIVIAVVLSAFSVKKETVDKVDDTTTFNWYVVDYSVSGGQIPGGAMPVLINKTQSEAQSADGCTDTNQLHCLRGFSGTPPAFPTPQYDSSTPKPL